MVSQVLACSPSFLLIGCYDLLHLEWIVMCLTLLHQTLLRKYFTYHIKANYMGPSGINS